MKNYLEYKPEVAEALEQKKPVVALESTVIAHGLPAPYNLDTALEMEKAVREQGAIPATIAFIDGKIMIGLDRKQINHLAQGPAVKASMRDIGLLLAEKATGATTVATTCWAAHQAGIKFFATGGIGGIHRENNADISADLPALATIPLAVICSGPKSILDIEKTREWLETWGVPILGFQCRKLPAFYTRQSCSTVDRTIESLEQAALWINGHLQWKRSAVLVGVPVPQSHEIPQEELECWTVEAEQEALKQGITGYALTPFLLQAIGQKSKQRTLKANCRLLVNNAEKAAQLAMACAVK